MKKTQDLALGKDFLKRNPKSQIIKEKKKLLDFIKIKKVCFTTDYAKKMKRKSQTIYK